jgi:tryptophan synthase alpha chain
MLTLPNMDYWNSGDSHAEPAAAATDIGEQRIAVAFATARRERRRAALMPFLMGGFPSLAASREIGEAYIDAGADLVELGIPCADPVCDGPVIRAAGDAALRAGATVEGVLGVAKALSARVPVVVMCYAEVVVARGAWRFANELRDAGVSGLLVPDLPATESVSLRLVCDCAGVALVPLVSPATADDEVADIGTRARGFVYAASANGPTGERAALADGVDSLIGRVKSHTSEPVALGFGISTPEHAVEAVEAGADAIIVGSRLVRAVGEVSSDAPAAVHALVSEFAQALTGVWPRLRLVSRLDVTDPRWRPDGAFAEAA